MYADVPTKGHQACVSGAALTPGGQEATSASYQGRPRTAARCGGQQLRLQVPAGKSASPGGVRIAGRRVSDRMRVPDTQQNRADVCKYSHLRVCQHHIQDETLCITKPGLSPGFVMHKGIPIAIVRLRQKTVRQYVLAVLEY